jgi:hypothetical protein
MTHQIDAFALAPDELERLLDPAAPFFPELEAARANPGLLRSRPQLAELLERSAAFADAEIPTTRYTDYRRFLKDGDRPSYEVPYFDKRAAAAAAALRIFLVQGAETAPDQKPPQAILNQLHDLIWSICEETNWVAPAHETRRIDLFAAETGFLLAETLALLGPAIDPEVRSRVRQEVERRIFAPYLAYHSSENWYQGRNNWNGVCNSSVAATFLLLEPEPGRAARGLATALRGLATFLRIAFEEDGSSNEGVSYWHYGLINVVALSEMLRSRSRGAIDLLASERMRSIAAYPAQLQLDGPRFASFSDCDEILGFHPGIITRLSERTGVTSLQNLVGDIGEPGKRPPWRLPMNLRNLLWWDGERPARQPLTDSLLPVSGVARLVGSTADGTPIVLAIKAGHNDENHNQNDVGSFIVHAGGENLLVDPGRGLYNRFYFGPQRYENIFANSYGHSVPVIGQQLQAPGVAFHGQLLGVELSNGARQTVVEFARAYPVSALSSLRRTLALSDDGIIHLSDHFSYAGDAPPVVEALVTWGEVSSDGATAQIQGEQQALSLTIEEPQGAIFQVERLVEASRANRKPGVLTRITAALPQGAAEFRVRMSVLQNR